MSQTPRISEQTEVVATVLMAPAVDPADTLVVAALSLRIAVIAIAAVVSLLT